MMTTTLSVSEAQAQLPELVARAARDAGPCYIEDNGQAVAVLVSLRSWQRRARRHGEDASTVAEEQERRLRAYERQMEQLGPEYWLPPDQQARLKELVEKEGVSLIQARLIQRVRRRAHAESSQFAHRTTNLGAVGRAPPHLVI